MWFHHWFHHLQRLPTITTRISIRHRSITVIRISSTTTIIIITTTTLGSTSNPRR